MCNFIANMLTKSEEFSELARIFRSYDTNGNGRIEKQELEQAMETIMATIQKPREKVYKLFERLDTDHSGAIEYSEFLAAGMTR